MEVNYHESATIQKLGSLSDWQTGFFGGCAWISILQMVGVSEVWTGESQHLESTQESCATNWRQREWGTLSVSTLLMCTLPVCKLVILQQIVNFVGLEQNYTLSTPLYIFVLPKLKVLKSISPMLINISWQNPGVDFGDVSERLALRKRLQCRSFHWYLEHVYPEMRIYNNTITYGEVRKIICNSNSGVLSTDKETFNFGSYYRKLVCENSVWGAHYW